MLFVVFFFQAGASLQQKADGWKQKVNDTRESTPRTPTFLDQQSKVQKKLLIILLQWGFYSHLETMVSICRLK